jgi:hypothetical protein
MENDFSMMPADADTLAWAEMDEGAQKLVQASGRALDSFLRTEGARYRTPSRDETTNVVDQGKKVSYCFPQDALARLTRLLDDARRAGIPAHLAERQGTPAAPNCGLMLDFDVVTADPAARLSDRVANRLAAALAHILARDVEFSPAGEIVHMFYIVKRAPRLRVAAAGAPPAAPAYK